MLLTKEQLEQRLTSPHNIINSVPTVEKAVVDTNGAQRLVEEGVEEGEAIPSETNSDVTIVKWGGHSTKEREHYKLTEEQRVTIGSLGSVFPTKDVAELTGVSKDCVRDLRNGKRGSSGYDENLKAAVDKMSEARKLTIQDKAMDKLLTTLGFITEDKLEKASVTEVSTVASNLSKIHANLEPKDSRDNSGPKVQVILFQPKPAAESHFETVEV